MARDLNDIASILEDAVNEYNDDMPRIEQHTFEAIQQLLNDLDLTRGAIKPTAKNLRTALKLQTKLDDVLNSDTYLKHVNILTDAVKEVADLNDSYFKRLFDISEPPTIAKAIREAAANNIVTDLTSVLSGTLGSVLNTEIQNAVIAGTSYNDIVQLMRDSVITNKANASIIKKYATQIATDSVNQYSAAYTVGVTSGLKFQWYQYTGTNIATTRDFCLACKKRKYIHVSEFPDIIKGEFAEFQDIGGKIYEKYDLPQGMHEGTNAGNFRIYRGGYNCGHQLSPMREKRVPQADRDRVYSTAAYKAWVKKNPGFI